MSYIYLSETEIILHELEEIRFCGDLLEIEPNEDNITGRIIMQPLEDYYELLRRLREIEANKNDTKRYLSYDKYHWGEKVK